MQTINKILKKFRKPEILKKIAVIFVQQNTNSWWSENASCCWLGRPGVSQQLQTIHFRYHIDLSCHWQIQSSWTCYRQVHSWYCLPTQRLRIQPQTQHGLCLYPGGAQIVQRNWRRMCHLQKAQRQIFSNSLWSTSTRKFHTCTSILCVSAWYFWTLSCLCSWSFNEPQE